MKRNLIAILTILFAGLWMLQPAQIGNSQTNNKEVPISVLKEQSQQLDEQRDQIKDELLEQVSKATPAPKPSRKERHRKKELVKDTTPIEDMVLRVNKRLIYDIEPEFYKGVVIVDVNLDSLNHDWIAERDIALPLTDTCKWVQSNTEKHKVSWINRVINRILFRKPGKK